MSCKARVFPGAGLAVPCDSRVDWVRRLAPGCGKIVKTKRRRYATNFDKLIVYMEKCKAEALIRKVGSSFSCWLTMLTICEEEVEGGEEGPGSGESTGSG